MTRFASLGLRLLSIQLCSVKTRDPANPPTKPTDYRRDCAGFRTNFLFCSSIQSGFPPILLFCVVQKAEFGPKALSRTPPRHVITLGNLSGGGMSGCQGGPGPTVLAPPGSCHGSLSNDQSSPMFSPVMVRSYQVVGGKLSEEGVSVRPKVLGGGANNLTKRSGLERGQNRANGG